MKFTFTSNKIRFESNSIILESTFHFFSQEEFSNSLLNALRNAKDEEKAQKALDTCTEICKEYLSGEIITRDSFQERVNKVISEL